MLQIFESVHVYRARLSLSIAEFVVMKQIGLEITEDEMSSRRYASAHFLYGSSVPQWVIGKMRNCGMRNAESKMRNRKLWKWMWNGG